MKPIEKLSERDEKILAIIEEAIDWKTVATEERKKEKEEKAQNKK